MAAESQVTVFDFTKFLKDDDDAVEETKELLEFISTRWAFQLEKCPKTSKLHYQGRFRLRNRTRLSTVVKRMKGTALEGAHLSITSGACRKNMFYVTKADTRVDGPWMDREGQEEVDNTPQMPRQWAFMKPEILHPWQKHVYDRREAFDTRTINFVVTDGNKGKSTFVGWMTCSKHSINLPPFNDFRDLMQYACSLYKTVERKQFHNIFVDFPRALMQTKLYSFMAGLERLKDGCLFDPRHSATERYIDSPNIWVFCNSAPDISSLSIDRWLFWTIDQDRQFRKVKTSQSHEAITAEIASLQSYAEPKVTPGPPSETPISLSTTAIISPLTFETDFFDSLFTLTK